MFHNLFTYLRESRSTKWGQRGGGRGRAEGEAVSPLSRELDAGLDPRILNS